MRSGMPESGGERGPLRWPALDPPRTVLRFPLEPHALTSEVTPARDLFVLAHLGVPRIDPGTWFLDLCGLLARPRRLSLAELQSLPSRAIEAFLQCAGNPAAPKVPARLIANVVWRGVELRTLLDAAGVRAPARFVWSFGLDRGEFLGVKSGPYLKDLPLERALTGDVLVAYELNGQPLPAEHGFPARLVVPGYYGTNSVKWLYRIEVADRRAEGPFTTTFYNDTVTGALGQRSQPVWNVAPESVIVSPAPGAVIQLPAGRESVEIQGWAWADAGVAQVEVSCDAGRTWAIARLAAPHERSWQRFSLDWTPRASGRGGAGVGAEATAEIELQCRATDREGRTQPSDGARNAVHKVTVRLRG